MKHRTTRGAIRYTSNKPERLGKERGREYFSITRQADGARILHAHCEIDDEPNVVRDVVLALDGQWNPTDCSVRLTVGDRYEGTGFMRFADGHAECWKWKGRETIAIPRRLFPRGDLFHDIIDDAVLSEVELPDGRRDYGYMVQTEDGLQDLQRLQRATWGRLGYSSAPDR